MKTNNINIFQSVLVNIILFLLRIIWIVDVVLSISFPKRLIHNLKYSFGGFTESLKAFELKKVLSSIHILKTFILSVSLITTLSISLIIFLNKDIIFGSLLYIINRSSEDLSLSQRYINIPVRIKNIPIPGVTANSYLVVDKNKDRILIEKDSYKRLEPASTTKLMTALVSLDLYKLDEVLVIPSICTTVDSTKAWLVSNSKVTVRDLVYSMLVSSAGDSACTLATGKVSYGDFINKMNEKANLIGMSSSYFANPIGLDGENGDHFSTAWDLYLLSKEATNNPIIKDAVSIKEYFLITTDLKYSNNLKNTNILLWDIPGSVGIKTGTTQAAGEVLIYEYKKDDVDLIIIVMGSTDRFSDTKNLLEWTLSSYSWKL